MTRNRKTVDLYCVKKRKLQNKKLRERSIESKTHQTNLVPRVLWVISKMAGRPAILEITHKTLGTRLPSNLSNGLVSANVSLQISQ